MTTSRSKAVGSQAEREVAYRFKNGRRVGMDGGPVDVIAEPFYLQVKCTFRALSMNKIREALVKMPAGNHLRGVVTVSRPGMGFKAQRSITFDLDEFTEWYG